MGRPAGCKRHDQGGLSVCSSTCLPVDAQGGYWGTTEVLARTVGRAGGQRLVSAKGPSLPTSGDRTGLPSSLPFPHTCGRSSLHARAHLHTQAKDTDPYIHKWLIHTQAQHCDQLNPNWLSRAEYLTFRPQNLKNPGPGTQGRVSESKGQKVQVVSGSGFVPGGTTWLACQPVSWASWFCTFGPYLFLDCSRNVT